MILLHDLKGAMQLDFSKGMFVHVSTCTSYDINRLTLVVWKLCLFLHVVTKVSDKFLKQ